MPTELYKSPGPKLRAIIKPHGNGKTEAVIDMLRKDSNLCVLVVSHQRQRQIEQEYPAMQGRVFSNPTLITGTNFKGIIIDNIEDFLPALPKPIAAFSITGNPEEA